MSKYLIEKSGEKQWVGSLDGYDKSWTVHGKGDTFAPKEYHIFENGKWIHQPEAEAKAIQKRKIDDLTNTDLINIIEELTARVAALEAICSTKINIKPEK